MPGRLRPGSSPRSDHSCLTPPAQPEALHLPRSLCSPRPLTHLTDRQLVLAPPAMDRMRSPSFMRADPGGLLDGSDSEEIEVEDSNHEAGEGESPVELRVFQDQRYDCYQDFIGKLPVNYRTVVALSELEGLVANQIAEGLGVSVDVVKIRLHRGRARLLHELRTHCNAEDWL